MKPLGTAWICGILLLHVILCLVYWHATPFGNAPDETAHGSYVQSVASAHAFPRYDPASAEGYEFYQPPLYYMAAAPFYVAGRLAGMSMPQETVRLLSIILGALSVLFIYMSVARLRPNDRYVPISAAGFVALLPTHVMMSSSVSNDVLMELIFNVALFTMIVMLTEGITMRRSIILGIVLGLGVLSKMTCLVLIPIALAAFLLATREGKSGAAWKQASLCILVALVVSGWWLIRNFMLYKDPLALAQMQQAFASHSPNPFDWFRQGMSPGTYLGMVVILTFKSFWGVFGYMNVFMPDWIYALLAVLTVAIKVAAVTSVRKSTYNAAAHTIIFLTLILVALAFLKLNMTVFQAQGRYLYPALLPISYMWVLGIRKLSRDHEVLACIMVSTIAILTQGVAIATLFGSI